MRDYDGPMEFYQEQLTRAGITKEQLNISDWAGLTANELQSIVDSAIKERKVNG